MSRLILVDGNSIMNRAFYGIMGSKMLMTSDGIYTNAVYGFLSILFKIQEDLEPEYMAVAFDLKGPTKRHEMYEEYKANRHGMPDELAVQMPIVKDILRAMNISIVEKQGFEGDDVLGTLSKEAEIKGMDVTILSGDRDTFQLASDKITIRIPRTKMGKTENEDYDRNRILDEYGIEPEQLIEVKGLMGDSSDNIPGVPGVGEKTALNLIRNYQTIEKLYNEVENNPNLLDVRGKLKEKILDNKELAFLSKQLGEIDRNTPLDIKIESLRLQEWNKKEVYQLFKYLRFNRFIERFHLEDQEELLAQEELFSKKVIHHKEEIKLVLDMITKENQMIYYIAPKENDGDLLDKEIEGISFYNSKENVSYYLPWNEGNRKVLKPILENNDIKKIGYAQKEDIILLKKYKIDFAGINYDIKIASYIINPNDNKYTIEKLATHYLKLDINSINEEDNEQINLFDVKSEENIEEKKIQKSCMKSYAIANIYLKTLKKLKETNQEELFYNIEMPLVEVLADMQYQGICVDKKELIDFGNTLKEEIQKLTKEIYKLAGEEFNINSTKQLGNILFEKLKLPVIKKTKNGYSTDVEVLEKLKKDHKIIEKILDYRQLGKLNSTYVEGLIPYIRDDHKIHSCFHQTVTATGRISSTDPNLQNIPTRVDLGKQIRKVFKPEEGYVFVDADYSQIELRVLAHVANDEHMIRAFNNEEDIHRQTASKVFNIPFEEVTSKERSDAKAVNFGIVYGISDFGLGEQLGIPRKQAKQYIDQYFEKYPNIKEFMDTITVFAKEKGYVETLFHRRRYIPEMNSNNYMVRQFGARIAMNTPIQGTAADIMKIAMITLYQELKEKKLQSKILLQIHDELLLQVKEEEKEEVKNLLRVAMENAMKMKVPLKVELSEASNWYEAK